MAREEFSIELTADDSASQVIDKVADKTEQLTDRPVEIELDAEVSGALSALDQVADEAKRTAEAAEALGRAMGPELTGRADTTAIVGDLRQMGLSLEQITANADQLGAKLREVADADVGGKIGTSLGTTRGQMDQLRSSSDQTRSVMANLAGNASQDLGQLGGVAGSAGVAIGQLAEYAVDGNIALGNLAKTAIPLLGVAAAAGLAAKSMSDIKEKAQFRTDQVDRFADSLMEGADAAEILAAELEKVGDLKFETGLGVTLQIRDALGQLGLTVTDFTELTAKSNDQVLDWANRMKAAGADASALDQVVVASAYARQQLATADERAAITTSVLGDESSIAKDKIEAQKDATEEAADAAEEAARAQEEQAEAVAEATKAWQDYVGVVKSVDWQEADIIGATSAIEGYRDQMFGLTRINADYQESVDAFTQSLKDNGDTFDLNTEKGRANQAALEDLAGALDTRLVAAYGDANGSLEAFQLLSEGAFLKLTEDLGLSAEQAERLRDQLNMTPEEVETRFKLSQDAEALQKLQLLQGAIGALPTDVQLQIGAKIAEGDLVGAAQLATSSMNAAVAGSPVVMPLTGDPTPVEGTIAAVQANEYTTIIDVTADPAPAEETTEEFTSTERETDPVSVIAETAIAAAILLEFISRPRKTTIAVGTSGVPDVEAQLNRVARARNTVVNVGTSGVGAVDATLDALTRSRSVTITPRVAPTTVLVRVDGGGP